MSSRVLRVSSSIALIRWSLINSITRVLWPIFTTSLASTIYSLRSVIIVPTASSRLILISLLSIILTSTVASSPWLNIISSIHSVFFLHIKFSTTPSSWAFVNIVELQLRLLTSVILLTFLDILLLLWSEISLRSLILFISLSLPVPSIMIIILFSRSFTPFFLQPPFLLSFILFFL